MTSQHMDNIYKNPHKDDFERAKKWNSISSFSIWVSAGTIFLAYCIRNIEYAAVSASLINMASCFFIVLFVLSDFMKNHNLRTASVKKREDFIDNSFETSISKEKSINYFTNDRIRSGIYKMGVNSFENVLFTYEISKKMLCGVWVKNVLFAFLFIVFAILGFSNAIILLIQLSLPILLLQQAIGHTVFVNRVEQVYENFRKLFNELKYLKFDEQKFPIIIHCVMEYETALSWANILLSSKVYEKLNPTLSTKWEKIKEEYEIK